MGISFFEILNFLGSLGLFLVGMKVMSDSLMELAGNRMRRVMASLTSNRFLAALTGLLVTGLIQSSSATTLMVVSFVNAGLLSLVESLGVIMGANIGTTFTAWLIAILGFKISMVDIALPMMIVGFAFYMRNNKQAATLGGFIIGFALLFIGLDFMKQAIPDLGANVALFEAIEKLNGHGIWSLLVFVLLGTVLTLLMQSSSATMAIALVAVSQGWLPFDAACAIVLGENIGTTITANMAAYVSSISARRAALAHMIFNLIGVVWVLVLFRPFVGFVAKLSEGLLGASPMTNPADAPVGLAVFHSAFNIINTGLLIGFVGSLASLVTRLLREREALVPDKAAALYLTDAALNYPQTAVHAALKESRRLYRGPVLDTIMQGINVPPTDFSGELDIPKLVAGSRDVVIPDFENVATNRLEPIYREILEFGAKVHGRFTLEEEEGAKLRNVGFAARDALLILGHLRHLNREMDEHMNDENPHVRGAFDQQRVEILELLEHLFKLDYSMPPEPFEAHLLDLDKRLKVRDLERSEEISQLLAEGVIPADLGVSLFTSSALVSSICRLLIRSVRHIGEAAGNYDEVEIELQPAVA